MKTPSRIGATLAMSALVACASVPDDAGFEGVEELTSTRLEQRIRWRKDTDEDRLADEEVAALLSRPLTIDAAVQVALLENRGMQAEYEHLGIAQADLVQAGLLSNPVFAASARFPDGGAGGTNLELGIVQDFLDLLMRPARRSIAQAQFEATRLAVASRVVEFAAEVRTAYFEAQGADQAAAIRRLVVDAASNSAELARRLHEAGNISDLQLANEVGVYEDARVEWARADAERIDAREELTRLMGLWGERVAWTLPDGLPDVPAREASLEHLEERAIATRLDLAAARQESEVLARALGVTRDWRYLAVAEVGLDAERETDGAWLTGPELSLELPLFDQRQAAIARAVSELRMADQRVIDLAVRIRSEVRAARERLVAQRGIVEHYRSVVIPLREAQVALTKEEHDFMLVGTFELIAAKQAEYDAYHQYVEAVRDYWIVRSKLERAIGGSLDGGIDPAPAAPAMPDAPRTTTEPHEEHTHEEHTHEHGGS